MQTSELPTKKKATGTLLPLFSLIDKSKAGNETMAKANLFLHWLQKTDQHYWQLLPLDETHLIPGSITEHVPSPYKGYGVGIDTRYLSTEMAKIQPSKLDLESFLIQQQAWLPDYAFFCALRDYFKTDNWLLWDKDIRHRDYRALKIWKEKLIETINDYVVKQWQIHQELFSLRNKATKMNIQLIGDLPFYLPIQSPLAWMYQHILQINESGVLPRVSGVANEPKATYGRQLWGHPLYRWDVTALHPDIIAVFTLRLSYLSNLFHTVRLDHTNGFFLYGSIDPLDERNDKMLKGPGFPVFKAVVEHCRNIGLKIFAEDTAVELKNLRNAMEVLHVPGIRIITYAFNQQKNYFEDDYANITDYPTSSFVYTTTHDTETLLGYSHILTKEQKKLIEKKFDLQYRDDELLFAEQLRKVALESPGQATIVPIQDWLLSADRINVPGTEKEKNDPNWQYILPIPVEELPIIS